MAIGEYAPFRMSMRFNSAEQVVIGLLVGVGNIVCCVWDIVHGM